MAPGRARHAPTATAGARLELQTAGRCRQPGVNVVPIRLSLFLRRGARLRVGRVGLAGWLVSDHRIAVRSETRPAMARWVSS